jgi:hypothetical protein
MTNQGTDLADPTSHPQVRVRWRGLEADVDEELAPLIRALWRAGIHTCLSCQENRPGVAWIEFLTARDARKFLNRVAVYPTEAELQEAPFWETLYGRITRRGGEGDWEYDVFPEDWDVEEKLIDDEVEETCTGPADFEFGVSIRFPRADLPLILQRFQSRRRLSNHPT